MEQITIGQIATAISLLVGLISGIGFLYAKLKTWVSNAFKEQLVDIAKRFDETDKKIDRVEMENCKNYLVRFMSDVEQKKVIDEVELERFFEEYERYAKLGGNSYIKHKYEKLKAEKKL